MQGIWRVYGGYGLVMQVMGSMVYNAIILSSVLKHFAATSPYLIIVERG